jgi:hypothetical protein
MSDRQRFYGHFDSSADVAKEFDADVSGCDILLAVYATESYEGSSWVVFRSADGTLFEVNGGHCSCNGLEGQWEPEATTAADIRFRFEKGTSCGMGYAPREAIEALLAELETAA